MRLKMFPPKSTSISEPERNDLRCISYKHPKVVHVVTVLSCISSRVLKLKAVARRPIGVLRAKVP